MTSPIDHGLKNQDKVLAICEAAGASTYVNAIGGMELVLERRRSGSRGVDLKFVKSKPFEYPQFGDVFVPWLSIIDVMMFNPKNQIAKTSGITRTNIAPRHVLFIFG